MDTKSYKILTQKQLNRNSDCLYFRHIKAANKSLGSALFDHVLDILVGFSDLMELLSQELVLRKQCFEHFVEQIILFQEVFIRELYFTADWKFLFAVH